MPMSMALMKAKSVMSIVLPAVGNPPNVVGGFSIIALGGRGGRPDGILLCRLRATSEPSLKPDLLVSSLVVLGSFGDALLISWNPTEAATRAARNPAIILQYSTRKFVPTRSNLLVMERRPWYNGI
jgi:hypothetical protein